MHLFVGLPMLHYYQKGYHKLIAGSALYDEPNCYHSGFPIFYLSIVCIFKGTFTDAFFVAYLN